MSFAQKGISAIVQQQACMTPQPQVLNACVAYGTWLCSMFNLQGKPQHLRVVQARPYGAEVGCIPMRV